VTDLEGAGRDCGGWEDVCLRGVPGRKLGLLAEVGYSIVFYSSAYSCVIIENILCGCVAGKLNIRPGWPVVS